MPPVTWYFDFVSPFAYICLHRLRELPPQQAPLHLPLEPLVGAVDGLPVAAARKA